MACWPVLAPLHLWPPDPSRSRPARPSGSITLLSKIEGALEAESDFVPVSLCAPFVRSDLVDRFHRVGRVEETSFDESGTTLVGYLPARELGRFAPFVAPRPIGERANDRERKTELQAATVAAASAG